MFLKEKRDSKIKGRTVTGGNKQRGFISKEDSSSPTVANKDVLFSCITYTEEERDVAAIYTPNAFIQKRVDNKNERKVKKLEEF